VATLQIYVLFQKEQVKNTEF